MSKLQRIHANFWFNGQAEEAADFYVSIFPNSRVVRKLVVDDAMSAATGLPTGALTVEFVLDGQTFVGLNGGPQFLFNEALSLVVNCADAAEVDHYWTKLGAGGDPKAQQCGWLKDKFGVSWQVVPTALIDMMMDKDAKKAARVAQVMMGMKKLELAELTRAYNWK